MVKLLLIIINYPMLNMTNNLKPLLFRSVSPLIKHAPKNQGELAGRAKLTDDDVLQIRQRYANEKITQKKLAIEFNVSQNLISKIVLRQNWTHI